MTYSRYHQLVQDANSILVGWRLTTFMHRPLRFVQYRIIRFENCCLVWSFNSCKSARFLCLLLPSSRSSISSSCQTTAARAFPAIERSRTTYHMALNHHTLRENQLTENANHEQHPFIYRRESCGRFRHLLNLDAARTYICGVT